MGSYTEACLMLLCATWTLADRPGCPPTCKCPEILFSCPPGAAPAPDTCGCGCTVCVHGLNSACDGFRPCDASQNLLCDYGGDSSGRQGVCKVHYEHQSCFHDGSEILHEQEFEINCESRCKCENGNIHCVPLCPEPEKPTIPNCEDMQLVTAPGECCAQWKCLKESSGSEDLDEPDDTYPAVDDISTGEAALIRTRREAPDFGEFTDTEQDEEPLEELAPCRPDTEWTPCSRTCGFGTSLRIVYEKESCIPKAEKRLCMIRPCKGQYHNANYTVLKATNVCSRVMRWSHPMHVRYHDCLSSRPLLLKFCGLCSDGRLCQPSLTHTRPVSFQCAKLNRKVTHQVMWVQRCECGGKKRNKGKSAKKPKVETTTSVTYIEFNKKEDNIANEIMD